mmetsp:Transcript_33523/g.59972  ORF Transcript_33523/g.59972 Transcript_33523/m.59972 type:complete len:82 (-) Transcript_33523:182-427(-)
MKLPLRVSSPKPLSSSMDRSPPYPYSVPQLAPDDAGRYTDRSLRSGDLNPAASRGSLLGGLSAGREARRAEAGRSCDEDGR